MHRNKLFEDRSSRSNVVLSLRQSLEEKPMKRRSTAKTDEAGHAYWRNTIFGRSNG